MKIFRSILKSSASICFFSQTVHKMKFSHIKDVLVKWEALLLCFRKTFLLNSGLFPQRSDSIEDDADDSGSGGDYTVAVKEKVL